MNHWYSFATKMVAH